MMEHSLRGGAPVWVRYIVAIALVALAAALRLWPLQTLGSNLEWLTFYPAVMIAAIYGGFYAGLLATVLSCITATFFWYLIVPNPFVLGFAQQLGMFVFILNGFLVSGVAEAMLRAKARAIKVQEQANAANQSRVLFENSPTGMVAVDPNNGRIVQANEFELEMVGYNAEEILTKTVVDLTYPEDRAESQQRYETLSQGLVDRVCFEKRYLRKDGSNFWAETSISALKDADGKVSLFIGNSIDITERKRAELALNESERRYRSLFENMLEGYAHCKMLYEGDLPQDFIYLDVNRKFEELTGLKDVVGKKVSVVIPGIRESNPELFDIYGRVAISGQPEKFETYVDALGIWFSISVYSPRHGHFVAVFDTITTRKQAELALRLERDRNQMYLDTVQTLIVALNAEGKISMINRAGCELLGFKESELLGCNWFETCLPQPESMNVIYPMFHKIMGGSLSSDEYYENSVRCRDGTLRLIAWRNTYITDDAGRNVGTLSSGEDITTQKLAEMSLRESENRFRIIFSNAIDGILLIDAETRKFVMANPAMANMLGYDGDEILGIGVEDIHPEEALPGIIAGFNQRLTGEFVPVPDVPVKRKDGSVFYANLSPSPVILAGKVYMMVVFRDITESKKTENSLRQAAIVFESSHDGAIITDLSGCILAVNHAYLEITGYSEAEFLGRNPRMLNSGRHNRDFFQSMWAKIKEAGYWQGEIWNRRKNGELYPERLTVSAVKNTSGETTHYVGMSSDLSQIKQSETQLEHLAHYDPLTDMPNRLLVHSHLTHAISQAKRLRRQVGVLYLDLDRFKSINDSLGYQVGDELLVNLAKRLTSRMRSEDMLARLGGDEFLLVMEHVEGPEDIAGVAQSLLELLEQPFVLSGEQEVFIGASIGVSVFPNDGNSANQLIQYADAAMNLAKKQGRNTFRFYTDSLTRAATERLELEIRLRHAITAKQLLVYYQPQVNIATGHIIGAEALVRWLDPERGLIQPVNFIPLAEETGLISAIGEYVLRETCLQGVRWIKAGLPFLTLAVNLSPHQFMRGNIAELVSKVLAETEFPACRLELELTESALMEQEEAAVKMLHLLRAQDIRLAIDDFGTGYSSLAYLKRFPLDILKIDKSFVDDIPFHQDDMEIAATIIAMGHTLGFKVLAEGVETAEQLAFLQAKGCDMYQGYLTSPPVTAEEFEKLFKKSANQLRS